MDNGGRPTPAAPEATATAVEGVADEPTEEPPSEETYNTAPDRTDFLLDLKTKSKQCFGSAGCNVTVEPTLSYLGLLPLDPDETYSITYEVRGGEDGAVIQTMELTNQTSLSYQPVAMSTAKSSSKLTAENRRDNTPWPPRAAKFGDPSRPEHGVPAFRSKGTLGPERILQHAEIMPSTTRITVTLPSDQVADYRKLTDNVSGYVAEAVARQMRHRCSGMTCGDMKKSTEASPRKSSPRLTRRSFAPSAPPRTRTPRERTR
ncbi:hypothetical protein SMICM17S_04513 [Streptomyces microflavus]